MGFDQSDADYLRGKSIFRSGTSGTGFTEADADFLRAPEATTREVVLGDVTPIETRKVLAKVEAVEKPTTERDLTYSYHVPALVASVTPSDVPDFKDIPYTDFLKHVHELPLNILEKLGTDTLRTTLPLVAGVWSLFKRFPVDVKSTPWEKLMFSTPKDRRGFPSFAGDVPLNEILNDPTKGVDYIASRMAASFAAYAYATEGKFQGQSLLSYTRANERQDGRDPREKSEDVHVAIITDAETPEGHEVHVVAIKKEDLTYFTDDPDSGGWTDLMKQIRFRRDQYGKMPAEVAPKTIPALSEVMKRKNTKSGSPPMYVNMTLDLRLNGGAQRKMWSEVATIPTSLAHVTLQPELDLVTVSIDHIDAEAYRALRTVQAVVGPLYTAAELPADRVGRLKAGTELTPPNESRPVVVVDIPSELRFVDVMLSIRETLEHFGVTNPSILVPTLPKGNKPKGLDARQLRIIPGIVPSTAKTEEEIKDALAIAKKHGGILEASLATTFNPHMPDLIKNHATTVLKWLGLKAVAEKTAGNAVDTQAMLDYEDDEFKDMAERFISFCTIPNDPKLDCFTVAVNENRRKQQPINAQKTMRMDTGDYVDEFSGKPMGDDFVRYHATVSANGKFAEPERFKEMLAFFQERVNSARERILDREGRKRQGTMPTVELASHGNPSY